MDDVLPVITPGEQNKRRKALLLIGVLVLSILLLCVVWFVSFMRTVEVKEVVTLPAENVSPEQIVPVAETSFLYTKKGNEENNSNPVMDIVMYDALTRSTTTVAKLNTISETVSVSYSKDFSRMAFSFFEGLLLFRANGSPEVGVEGRSISPFALISSPIFDTGGTQLAYYADRVTDEVTGSGYKKQIRILDLVTGEPRVLVADIEKSLSARQYPDTNTEFLPDLRYEPLPIYWDETSGKERLFFMLSTITGRGVINGFAAYDFNTKAMYELDVYDHAGQLVYDCYRMGCNVNYRLVSNLNDGRLLIQKSEGKTNELLMIDLNRTGVDSAVSLGVRNAVTFVADLGTCGEGFFSRLFIHPKELKILCSEVLINNEALDELFSKQGPEFLEPFSVLFNTHSIDVSSGVRTLLTSSSNRVEYPVTFTDAIKKHGVNGVGAENVLLTALGYIYRARDLHTIGWLDDTHVVATKIINSDSEEKEYHQLLISDFKGGVQVVDVGVDFDFVGVLHN